MTALQFLTEFTQKLIHVDPMERQKLVEEYALKHEGLFTAK